MKNPRIHNHAPSPTRAAEHLGASVIIIELRGGKSTIVDAADWPRIAAEYGRRWWVDSNGYGKFYARALRRDDENNKADVTLGRAVMEARPGERVEAINGDPLDCRRTNLRLVRRRQAAEVRQRFADRRAAEVRA